VEIVRLTVEGHYRKVLSLVFRCGGGYSFIVQLAVLGLLCGPCGQQGIVDVCMIGLSLDALISAV